MGQEYQVLQIQELTRLSPAGNLDKFYRHRILTRGGVSLTVDILEHDFVPDKVSKALLKAAQNADSILKL